MLKTAAQGSWVYDSRMTDWLSSSRRTVFYPRDVYLYPLPDVIRPGPGGAPVMFVMGKFWGFEELLYARTVHTKDPNLKPLK